jgi:hypothetical protein
MLIFFVAAALIVNRFSARLSVQERSQTGCIRDSVDCRVVSFWLSKKILSVVPLFVRGFVQATSGTQNHNCWYCGFQEFPRCIWDAQERNRVLASKLYGF